MNQLQALFSDFWWVIPLAGGAFAAYRLLGWRGLLAVVTLGGLGGVYTAGKRAERARQAAEAAEQDRRAMEVRHGVDNKVAGMDPDTKRNELSKWMRDGK